MAKDNAGRFRILSLDGGGFRGIITAVWPIPASWHGGRDDSR